MTQADSKQEVYFKGVYPVEVVSEVEDGFVEVRAKRTFLLTTEYPEGARNALQRKCRRLRANEKRWIRAGEVFRVPSRTLWKNRRPVPVGRYVPKG